MHLKCIERNFLGFESLSILRTDCGQKARRLIWDKEDTSSNLVNPRSLLGEIGKLEEFKILCIKLEGSTPSVGREYSLIA